MHFVTLKHASVSVSGTEACNVLQTFIGRCNAVPDCKNESRGYCDLYLDSGPNGLELAWRQSEKNTLKFQLDFEKELRKHRSFPIPKQGAFNQSLGKKTLNIVDATGGWGGDALLMCMQGYKVTIIERLPLMAAMIDEALQRLSKTLMFQSSGLTLPVVMCGDAAAILPELADSADCVYLDPMFPAKKKKSAASNKKMQLLQWLAGPDLDADTVAIAAARYFPRLAVKRPDYATPLAEQQLGKPNTQFSSKLVHYDVYLRSERDYGDR